MEVPLESYQQSLEKHLKDRELYFQTIFETHLLL